MQEYPHERHRAWLPALAVVVATLGCNLAAQAADVVWLGGDGEWLDASRWSGGVVPGVDSDVYVDANDSVGSTVRLAGTSGVPRGSVGRLFVAAGDAVDLFTGLDVWGGQVHLDGRLLAGRPASTGIPTLRLHADTVLSGTGEIVLGQVGSSSTYGAVQAWVPDAQLEIGASLLIRGSGILGANGGASLDATNFGRVLAEGERGISIGARDFDNRLGRIEIADQSALIAETVGVRVHGGVIESLGYATLGKYNGGGGTIAGATLIGSFGARSLRLEDVTVIDRLETTTNGSSTLLSGQWQVLGDLVVNGGNRATIDGGLLLGGTGTTWLVQGVADEGAELVGQGALTIDAGHTLRGHGRMESDEGVNQGLVQAEGGVLRVTRATTFDSTNGVLHAAHDGTMSFENNVELMLSDASTIVVDVAGYAPGSGFGLITTLDGDIVLDGQVSFAFGSFAAAVGDEFTFFLHDNRVTGQFDSITNDRGYLMGLRYDPTSVTAYIQAVPEPQAWALFAGGLALVAWRQRRSRRADTA